MELDSVIGLLKIAQGKKNQKEFAIELGVSPQYLNDVYLKRREPGDSILKPMGLMKVISYQPAKDQPQTTHEIETQQFLTQRPSANPESKIRPQEERLTGLPTGAGVDFELPATTPYMGQPRNKIPNKPTKEHTYEKDEYSQ